MYGLFLRGPAAVVATGWDQFDRSSEEGDESVPRPWLIDDLERAVLGHSAASYGRTM